MTSLFILNINGNPFLAEEENYLEKFKEFCPTLEIIDDVKDLFDFGIELLLFYF